MYITYEIKMLVIQAYLTYLQTVMSIVQLNILSKPAEYQCFTEHTLINAELSA